LSRQNWHDRRLIGPVAGPRRVLRCSPRLAFVAMV
jgi:hypothetical protein